MVSHTNLNFIDCWYFSSKYSNEYHFISRTSNVHPIIAPVSKLTWSLTKTVLISFDTPLYWKIEFKFIHDRAVIYNLFLRVIFARHEDRIWIKKVAEKANLLKMNAPWPSVANKTGRAVIFYQWWDVTFGFRSCY